MHAAAPHDRIDYFFVGVGKCGTTWLYEFVRRHGLATVPAIKEPYFLDQTAEEQQRQLARLWARPTRRCDFSNTYYWDPRNPRAIRDHNPAARIIITVRQPSARARSHHRFLVRNGTTTQTDFEDYLAAGDDLDVVERCDYGAILDRYRAVVPPDQILVLPLEQLSSDPQLYVDRLCNFLDREPVEVTEQDLLPVLARREPRHSTLSRVAKATAVGLRRAGALRLLGGLKRSSTVQRLLFQPSEASATRGAGSPRLRELDAAYERLLDDPVTTSHARP